MTSLLVKYPDISNKARSPIAVHCQWIAAQDGSGPALLLGQKSTEEICVWAR